MKALYFAIVFMLAGYLNFWLGVATPATLEVLGPTLANAGEKMQAYYALYLAE